MDLSMEYKGAVFNFELFTDRRNNRQLWMEQSQYQEWECSTEKLPFSEKQEEEFEFYTSIQDHLECLGRSYEIWVDKWQKPEPSANVPNWYLLDDDEEE